MHPIPILALVVLMTATAAGAQGTRIWRCGNSYTNSQPEPSQGCKLVEGGNVTVVEGTRPAGGASGTRVAAATPAGRDRIEAAEQRARDADARQILEAELRKAEARRADLLKEYNNGEPEKQGAESRNYQKYLDRVAELKASIGRVDNDIAGIQRELGRLGSASGSGGGSSASAK